MKKITFEHVFPFQDLPLLVAHQEGLLVEEGIEVEFVGGGYIDEIKTDKSVTNPEGISSMLGHASRLEEHKAVMYNACEWGNYRRVQDTGCGSTQVGRRHSIAYGAIIVPPWSNVHTPQQLANVTVGVPYYNGTHYLAIQMLEGFLPRDAIKTCSASPKARMRYESLMRGEVEATTVVEPYIALAEKEGCRVVVQSCYTGTEVATDELDAETYAAYKRAVAKAVHRVNADPRKYAQYFIDYHKDDPKVAAMTADDFKLGRIVAVDPAPIPEDELRRTYEWMVSWNMISEDFGTERLVDPTRQSAALAGSSTDDD